MTNEMENEAESTVPTFTTEEEPEQGAESDQSEAEVLDEMGNNPLPPGENMPEEEESVSKSKQLFGKLRSTEPHVPLEEIEPMWDMEKGGIPRVQRGLQKVGGFEQTEAWLDISVGILEIVYQNAKDPQGTDSESEESDGYQLVDAR